MPSTSEAATVTLTGGLTVSLTALRLGWGLEARGVTLRLDADGLAVGPSRLLTDADRDGIREHRAELLALATYCEAIQ